MAAPDDAYAAPPIVVVPVPEPRKNTGALNPDTPDPTKNAGGGVKELSRVLRSPCQELDSKLASLSICALSRLVGPGASFPASENLKVLPATKSIESAQPLALSRFGVWEISHKESE